MGKYTAKVAKTNTVSSTVPMWNLVGAASRRLKLLDLIIGCAATPADQASLFQVRRTTADGTPSSSFTPNKFDNAEGASIAALDTAWSVDPTITANSDLLGCAFNQRTWFRWVAREGEEIITPATAEAGLALLSDVSTSAASHHFTVIWEE